MLLYEEDTTLNNFSNETGDRSMIKIFSKPRCPYCERAKQYLDNLEIEYNEVDITKDPMAHSFIIKEGHKTVPQIYHNNELLFEGGYNGLVKYSKEQINEMIGDINVSQLGIEI